MVLSNLTTRILAGIVFVVILLAGILFNQYLFLLIFSLIAILALWEFYGLVQTKAKVRVVLNVIGGYLLFLGAYFYFALQYQSFLVLVPFIIYLLVLFISSLFKNDANILNILAYSVLGQMYIAVPFALLNYICFSYQDGIYHYIFLLALFIFVWVNDSFAYLTGSKFGKHRLFERISPKKSWEGAIGGAVFTIIAAVIIAQFYTELSVFAWIGFALVVVVFGSFGDLFESQIKRSLGKKDSGKLIPGHGGILDRFDSAILSIPALFVYIELISYICNK